MKGRERCVAQVSISHSGRLRIRRKRCVRHFDEDQPTDPTGANLCRALAVTIPPPRTIASKIPSCSQISTRSSPRKTTRLGRLASTAGVETGSPETRTIDGSKDV